MPENWQGQNNANSNSSNASADNIEEGMWRLKIQAQDDDEGGLDAHCSPYPDRPGEPDCIYYLRTGLCRYGSNCRFNHPANTGQASEFRDEFPERVGQPDCQYFLKTGSCKFGAICKYHHPRDRLNAGQVPLNMLGLPIRQEEKSCSYYMRTGGCKFGIACKFHHPQPAQFGAVLPMTPSTYDSTGLSATASSGLPYVGGLPAWSLPRAPYMSSPRGQGHPAYMPIISPSQSVIPTQHDWSIYTSTASPILSTDAFGSNQLPERPDQPDCQFYMKNGSCKFGQGCKYHHPKQMNAYLANGTLGPLGLPLRPGQAICTSYGMYGICKYGSACKFDHPFSGYYNYSLPAFSIPGLTPVPYYNNSITLSSTETSPSKSLSLQNRPTKPESESIKQNPVAEAPEDMQQQTTYPSDTAPTSSESPHDQSD